MDNFEGKGVEYSTVLSAMSCVKRRLGNGDAVWDVDLSRPKEVYLIRDAYWRQLANMIEPSLCSGDTVFYGRHA